MDLLTALHSRTSSPRLAGDVPSDEILEGLFQAAMRAPDHAQLRPWRFLLVSGEDRNALGDLFAKAKQEDNPESSANDLNRIRLKPLRAPLIIVAIASVQPHPKVPEIEQVLSAGAAVQNLILAASASNLGAMWRTGSMAFHATVMKGLGLGNNEQIVGFVYIGERKGKSKMITPLDSEQYFKIWPEIQ